MRAISPTDAADSPRFRLLECQYDELFDDEHFLTFHIGGRGSGKTKVNPLHFLRWGAVCTDKLYGLFANTWEHMENAILPPITEVFEEIGLEYVIEGRVPNEWRRDWRSKRIIVPQIRHRNMKLLITRSGIHIYLGTFGGNSWRRLKGLELLVSVVEEYPEPDTPIDFLTYLVGSTRCGRGRDGECKRRGHKHKIVVKGNVPLNNPSHFIYRQVERFQSQEEQRLRDKKRPFFRLISSSTKDNTELNTDFLENMEAALDARTYDLQTSGRLERNVEALSYYAFAEENILAQRPDGSPWLTYDPRRPLHIWFDFNATPAIAGWGHDLRPDEVPAHMLKRGHHYFGINGELFSGVEPMVTEQVALALLEDSGGGIGRCIEQECGHDMSMHGVTAIGWLCHHCGFQDKVTKRHCSGQTTSFAGNRAFIHATPNWHGLAKHRGPIYVYGDATGRGLSSQAASADPGGNIRILRNAFAVLGDRVHFRFPESNPRVVLRVAAMNAMFCAKDHVRSLFVAPHCTAHIDDFREVVPDPKTGEPLKVAKKRDAKPDDYSQRTHASDGAGYHVAYRWPVKMVRAGDQSAQLTPEDDYGPLANQWPEPQ